MMLGILLTSKFEVHIGKVVDIWIFFNIYNEIFNAYVSSYTMSQGNLITWREMIGLLQFFWYNRAYK